MAAVALATWSVTIVTFSVGTFADEISVDTLNGRSTSNVNLVFDVTALLLSFLSIETESIVTFKLRRVPVGFPETCAFTDWDDPPVIIGFPDISDCILDMYTDTVPSFWSTGLSWKTAIRDPANKRPTMAKYSILLVARSMFQFTP